MDMAPRLDAKEWRLLVGGVMLSMEAASPVLVVSCPAVWSGDTSVSKATIGAVSPEQSGLP